jgi:hypothetical protein
MTLAILGHWSSAELNHTVNDFQETAIMTAFLIFAPLLPVQADATIICEQRPDSWAR